MSKYMLVRNNCFTYRRVFPRDVQKLIGRRELKRKLEASTLKGAKLEAALLNHEFSRTVQIARGEDIQRDSVAVKLATQVLLQKDLLASDCKTKLPLLGARTPKNNTIEDQLAVSESREGQFVTKHDESTSSMLAQVTKLPKFTLADAALFYLTDNRLRKGRTSASQKKAETEQRRRLDLFAEWLGNGNKEFGYKTEFASINRHAAQGFKSYLIGVKQWKVATRNKCLTYLNSAFNAAGHELDIKGWTNPFRRLASDAQTDSVKRPSFTPSEYQRWWLNLLSYREQNTEAALIGLLMLETGSRIIELSHLVVDDLRLNNDVPHVLVRNNLHRQLKGVIEHPIIPLSTVPMLRLHVSKLQSKNSGDPLFPRYCTANGNSTLSATLKKRHVSTLLDDDRRNLTPYSARHAFKDRGRAAGVDLAVLDYLMGHKTKQSSVVAQGYGTGYSLTVLKEAAERINAQQDWGYLDQLAY